MNATSDVIDYVIARQVLPVELLPAHDSRLIDKHRQMSTVIVVRATAAEKSELRG